MHTRRHLHSYRHINYDPLIAPICAKIVSKWFTKPVERLWLPMLYLLLIAVLYKFINPEWSWADSWHYRFKH